MEFIKAIVSLIFYVGFGIVILKYRKQVKGWTGNFVWAEQYLGRGGTYIIIIMIGLGLVVYGTLDFLGIF